MEYITKQQAIDLANRLQAFIGLAGASVFIKEVERMDGFEEINSDIRPDGVKIIVLHKMPKGE